MGRPRRDRRTAKPHRASSRAFATARLVGWAAAALLLILAAVPAAAASRASAVGRWEAAMRWPTKAVHAAVLPTGEVLHFAYARSQGPQGDRYYYPGAEAKVWSPATGKFKDASIIDNIFCSGHSFLADGSLYVAGGLGPQERCKIEGTRETYTFDPFTRTWFAMDEMKKARYYPTNLTLGDGSVLVLAGRDENCKINPRMEIFIPGKGLRTVREGKRAMKMYPRAHLLPDGTVAHVGPEAYASRFEMGKGWTRIGGSELGLLRYESTSFQVPGNPWAVVICGGFEKVNVNPTATCEKIDFSEPNPRLKMITPMRYARGHIDAVLLPDGKVLVTGGGSHDNYTDPIRTPELYDPATDRWTLLPPNRYPRMYHSTSVLLSDGRVLLAGQDENPGAAHDSSSWAEIYRPPYLYRGKRPVIRSGPERAEHGEIFPLKVKNTKKMRRVVLMGLSSVTHSVNMHQRHVELDFEHAPRQTLEVEAPDNPNLAPPGYYMLFVLNKKDVPSEAHMIQLLPPAES